MAYKELEAEMSRITEQRDLLLKQLRDVLPAINPSFRRTLKRVKSIIADCEGEEKP